MSQPRKESVTRPTVVVAGASGFIGQALGLQLGQDYTTIGLSRRKIEPRWGYHSFRQVDFFSLRESEAALQGAQYAVYLIHSMLPAARLVQGHFSDLDIWCADNFARAAQSAGVKHIVFIGGLVPDDTNLSEHLKSRLEVESALGSKGVPVTTLRAGMVVGAQGSSYQLLSRLVRRLPIMACPTWTRTRMQPIAIDDVVAAIVQVISHQPQQNRVFDLGCPEVLSYQSLMAETARAFGLNRKFIPVPLLSPQLSRLWISLTTGAPKALAAPLIESLRHDMIARESHLFQWDSTIPLGVRDMLAKAEREQASNHSIPRAFLRLESRKSKVTVCSLQRINLPAGRNAAWASEEYLTWLNRLLKGIIEVQLSPSKDEIDLTLKATGQKLIGFKYLPHRSSKNRQVLMVTEGLLARKSDKARLEFRQVLAGDTLIAAVHDFVPRLPWWIYRLTQGFVHLWIMNRFRTHVAKDVH